MSHPSKIAIKSAILLRPSTKANMLLPKWFDKTFKLASDDSKLIEFEDFFKRTIKFLETCGSEPYLVNYSRETWKTVIIKFYYIIGLLHLDLLGLGECVIFKLFITDPDKMLIATSMAPCIIFIIGLNYKEYVLYADQETIFNIFEELRAMFPTTLEKQKKYKAHDYCYTMQQMELVFIASCNMFTTTFSFMPIIIGCKELYLGHEWDRVLPYIVWYPFDTTEPLSFHVFLYIIQLHAAYLAGVLFMGADLMMCAAISQNCMHLNYISTTIMEFKPRGDPKDIVFLGSLAKYHGKILE